MTVVFSTGKSTKYDKSMLMLSIPGMCLHAVCSVQHNNQLNAEEEEVMIIKYLVRL